MYISNIIKHNEFHKINNFLKEIEKEIFEKMGKKSWVSIELDNDDTSFCFLKERYDGVYQLRIKWLFLSNSIINLKIDSLTNSEDYLSWLKRLKDCYVFSKKLHIYDSLKATFEIDLLLGKNISFENLKIFNDHKLSLEIKGRFFSLADFQIWWANNLNNVHLDNDTEVFHNFIISSSEKDKVVITAIDEFWNYKKHNHIVFEKWDHLWQTSKGLFLQKQNGKCFLLFENSMLLEVPWEFENIQEVKVSNYLLSIITNKEKKTFRIVGDEIENFKILLQPEEECLNFIIGTSENIAPCYQFFKYNIENFDLTLLGRDKECLCKLNPTYNFLEHYKFLNLKYVELGVLLSKLNNFRSSFWKLRSWFLITKKENKWQMVNWFFIPLMKRDWLQWLIQLTKDENWLFNINLMSIDEKWDLNKEKQLFKTNNIDDIPNYCLLKERNLVILQSINGQKLKKWKSYVFQDRNLQEIVAPSKVYFCFSLHWRHYLLWKNKNQEFTYCFHWKSLSWKPLKNSISWFFEDFLNRDSFSQLSENRQLFFKRKQKFEVFFAKNNAPTLTFLENWKTIILKNSPLIYKNIPPMFWLTLPNCILIYSDIYPWHSLFMVDATKKSNILNARWKHLIKFQTCC